MFASDFANLMAIFGWDSILVRSLRNYDDSMRNFIPAAKFDPGQKLREPKSPLSTISVFESIETRPRTETPTLPHIISRDKKSLHDNETNT